MKSFTVNMKPRAQPRPRVTRNGGIIPNKGVEEYKEAIRQEARKVFDEPFDGPVALQVRFTRGESVFVTIGTFPEGDIKRPDGDNLIKAVMDALNGVAYHDDSQVVHGYWIKELKSSS